VTRISRDAQPRVQAGPRVAAEVQEAPPSLASPGVKCTKWVYLEPWQKAGRHRLYLFDHGGHQLGWKNLSDGRIVLTYERDQRLTRAVLAAASPYGLDLPKETVPRVPVQVPGGSFVSALTRTYTTIHIGRHWNKGQFDRMYCTAADPIEGVHDLGWVDLLTGARHPTHEVLPDDWAPADQRLRWLLERRPTIHS
jgi:hypothetical protein